MSIEIKEIEPGLRFFKYRDTDAYFVVDDERAISFRADGSISNVKYTAHEVIQNFNLGLFGAVELTGDAIPDSWPIEDRYFK